jgi:hypothetical protein
LEFLLNNFLVLRSSVWDQGGVVSYDLFFFFWDLYKKQEKLVFSGSFFCTLNKLYIRKKQ